MTQRFRPWAQAWDEALYGRDGFYRRDEGPAGHFRTASHAAPGPLAEALHRLARESGCTAIVDVGAGRGELLAALAALDVPEPLRLHGIDVVARPDGLPPGVGWTTGQAGMDPGLPAPDLLDDALLVAWELLDVVACPVVEVGPDGAAREVLVEPATGAERLGAELDGPARDWCRRWWPLEGALPGTRAEVGSTRDDVWAELVRRMGTATRGGLLLAVDYAHDRQDRPAAGSLAGFREGRAVAPRPDGSCDVTAHIALDAVAAAGEAAGARTLQLTTQREALRALGLGGPAIPGATTFPAGPAGPGGRAGPAGTAFPAVRTGGSGAELLAQLQRRSQVAELLDPGGLGGFGWLLQAIGR